MVINRFSRSTQLSMKLILLINVKMRIIFGIIAFISMINTHLRVWKQSNLLAIQVLWADKISYWFELSMKSVLYTGGQLSLPKRDDCKTDEKQEWHHRTRTQHKKTHTQCGKHQTMDKKRITALERTPEGLNIVNYWPNLWPRLCCY